MDTKRKTIVILSVIISLFFLILIFQAIQSGKDSDSTDAPEIIPVTLNEGNWPMFRGSQELLGIAQGQLPDSLEFLWRFKTDRGIKSSPVIDSNIVYIGSNDDNIYAIDLHTGEKVWSYKTDDSVEAPPLCINGMVYAGSLGGFMYAIDSKTGEFKWKFETDGSIYGSANWTYSPDKKSIWIIFGSYDNFLYCVNSQSGKLVWKYESDYYINGSPAIENQHVVFGGCDEVIHVISLDNGKQVAKIEDVSNRDPSFRVFEDAERHLLAIRILAGI